ncbi:hypothetical protein [Cardinium endosymbiont of Nabis limbatus]|uniref:hypothetical protein n=1 Tax=Cardinium endosymbiont of Nabis limbatus TaxID=3066217 RepID=UPI003AF336F5
MKTKHIQCRLGLLIGLFSLNTLSSCVNTKRGLGADDPAALQEEQGEIRDMDMDPARGELDGQQSQQVDNAPQGATRFSWIRARLRPITGVLRQTGQQPLMEATQALIILGVGSYWLSHYIGYNQGYPIGYARGSLQAYSESGFGL